MKIAQIGNTAGIGSILAEELKLQGHKVDVFAFDDQTQERFGGKRIHYSSIIENLLFHWKLASYDIWHYHYPYGTLLKNLTKKRKNQVFLKHYHGSDMRLTQHHEEDFCLVATPDLLDNAPNGVWFPIPLNLDETQKVLPNNDVKNGLLKIAHYPYYKINPLHEDYYTPVLNQLEKEGKCRVMEIINMDHKTALSTIASCDILLGKIYPKMGWFGKIELEAMALGKPVITFVSDQLYDKYQPPVFRTSNAKLKDDLISLIDDAKLRRDLSEEALTYVRKNHDAHQSVKNLLQYYNKLQN